LHQRLPQDLLRDPGRGRGHLRAQGAHHPPARRQLLRHLAETQAREIPATGTRPLARRLGHGGRALAAIHPDRLGTAAGPLAADVHCQWTSFHSRAYAGGAPDHRLDAPGRTAVAPLRPPSHPRRHRPRRYGALALLRHGLSGRDWPRAWSRHPLRDRYDRGIVGGGVRALAPAYSLAAHHGFTDVAVLDKGYIGGGGSGRSTAILRSNYLTPEGVRFYDRSMQLYRTLAADLDYNVMFSRRGHLTLAHNDSSLRTM